MERREFLKSVWTGATFGLLGLVGCGRNSEDSKNLGEVARRWIVDGPTVILYDTYAMALYMDGGLGPKTGVMKVDYILANQPVTLEFWHGHGGKNHQFTITPDHFKQIKAMKKVTITTTKVEGHTHNLFIDPVDPKWRVAGAKPVEVPVEPILRG